MKFTKKALEAANLSVSHFARLIGVNASTINRYFAKMNQKPESIEKIELAAQVLKESELIWPSIAHEPTENGHKVYLKNKKKSDSLDKKFVKALNKSMKTKK